MSLFIWKKMSKKCSFPYKEIKNNWYPISKFLICSNCTSEAMTCFWSGVIRWRRLSRRDRRNQFRTGWGKPSTSHSSWTRPPSPEYTRPSAEYTWTKKTGRWTVSDRYRDSSNIFVYITVQCAGSGYEDGHWTVKWSVRTWGSQWIWRWTVIWSVLTWGR